MHAKTLFFGVWKTQYDFLALRHLAVCTKIFFSFFKLSFCILEVLTKIGYFNIGFCIFSNIKILPDINQNDIKNTRENCKIPKKYFWFFLLQKKNWVEPSPPFWIGLDTAHILWAGLSQADVLAHNQISWLLSTVTSQLCICCRTWFIHVLHVNAGEASKQGRGRRSYLEWWRLLVAGVVVAPFLLLSPCFLLYCFFFLFLLSSFVSLLGATGGGGEEEQRWRCRAEGSRWWFFLFSLFFLCFFFFVFFHSALGLFLFSYSKSLSPLVFFYVFNYSKYPALFCFLHYLFPFFPSVSASLF